MSWLHSDFSNAFMRGERQKPNRNPAITHWVLIRAPRRRVTPTRHLYGGVCVRDLRCIDRERGTCYLSIPSTIEKKTTPMCIRRSERQLQNRTIFSIGLFCRVKCDFEEQERHGYAFTIYVKDAYTPSGNRAKTFT